MVTPAVYVSTAATATQPSAASRHRTHTYIQEWMTVLVCVTASTRERGVTMLEGWILGAEVLVVIFSAVGVSGVGRSCHAPKSCSPERSGFRHGSVLLLAQSLVAASHK